MSENQIMWFESFRLLLGDILRWNMKKLRFCSRNVGQPSLGLWGFMCDFYCDIKLRIFQWKLNFEASSFTITSLGWLHLRCNRIFVHLIRILGVFHDWNKILEIMRFYYDDRTDMLLHDTSDCSCSIQNHGKLMTILLMTGREVKIMSTGLSIIVWRRETTAKRTGEETSILTETTSLCLPSTPFPL